TYPERTAALVLVSTPGPGARLRAHHRAYLRWPRLLGPLFMVETPFRLWRELHGSQLIAVLTSRISFSLMARRARLIESTDIAGPAGRLEAILDEPPVVGGINDEGLVVRGRSNGLRAALVFAHPHPQYGGTMHTKVVFQAAKALTRIGCAVLRFNFRGVGTS